MAEFELLRIFMRFDLDLYFYLSSLVSPAIDKLDCLGFSVRKC